MFRKCSAVILALTLCAALPNGVARAYEKGGIAFILDHGKELNLNDEQKKKLNNMRTLEERTRVKLLAEADMKVSIHKVLEAKRKNDEGEMQEAFADLVKKLIEKSLPIAKGMMDDLEKLLTPDQIAKINELKEAQEQKSKPGIPKEDERNKPKRGTKAPNPFEF